MKKNLIVLLIIPFLIAILGVVTISTTYNLVDADIVSIDWSYEDVEGFKLSSNNYILNAVGVNQRGQEAENNKLYWSVSNKNTGEELHAEIIETKGNSYLKTISSGEVTITCKNEKGNVYRSFTGVIYETGVVLVTSTIKASSTNIDPIIYYGDTDLVNGNEVDASFTLNVRCEPKDMIEHLFVVSKTDNIEYDEETYTIKLSRTTIEGMAKIELGFNSDSGIISSSFNFKIINGGVNIYSYDDLMYVSENNKIGVLRKSFESVDNAFVFNGDSVKIEDGKPVLKSNNVECFGNYDIKQGKVVFTKDDLYHFTTTYNHNYIDLWNEFVRSKGLTNTIDDQIYCALRITNSFYGNGYTLNFHNLTYPTGSTSITQSDGSEIVIPTLAKDDIFRGPLPFYCLGDHNNTPLIEALGQDNIGLYLDGDGITLDDVNVKNCDFGQIFDTLNTVGTVVDINGDNVTIINSKISNGKNVVRSFSNLNLTIDNSLIQYAKCFLFFTGSNEYLAINDTQQSVFYDASGNQIRDELQNYLSPDSVGNEVMNNFLKGTFTNKNVMANSLLRIKDALNNGNTTPDEFKGTTTIIDSMFYYASVASIASEVLFNGPYLYGLVPSTITELLAMIPSQNGLKLSEFIPTNLSGISYKTKVEVKGNTRFYNYQTTDYGNHSNVDGLDISGLISENITKIASSLGEQFAVEVNIDKFFPIKDYLYKACSPEKEIYRPGDGNEYINVVAAWYGGGINNSEVIFEDNDYLNESIIGRTRTIDLTDSYLDLSTGSGLAMYKNMMLKAVTVVTGIEPFKFRCVRDGYGYGETPDITILKNNALSKEVK